MSPPPFQPELFGDFLLIQRLSRRRAAEALIAVRLGDRSGRTFVVKRPLLGERPSGHAAEAIRREGEVLAAVRAPGLPGLEARGELAGLPYVAVEHVRGAPLDELLAGAPPIEPGALRAIAVDLARALAALHEGGFVHGDVTPSNVIIDDAGEARLLDLGIARRIGESSAAVAGTPGYIAPEAALPFLTFGAPGRLTAPSAPNPGEARPAIDIYGWATVVAECALGRPVYRENELAEAASRGEPPRELRAWEERVPGLLAALSREPAARPSTAALIEGLSALPLERSDLAQRASAFIQGEAAAALTPTAPMAVKPAKAPPKLAPTLVDGLSEPVAATSPKPAAPRPLWYGGAIGFVALFVGALAAGFIVGRATWRFGSGVVYLGSVVPARAQIEIDGERAPVPVDGRLVLKPGDHSLAVVLPKGTRREYTFHVQANESLVLLSPGRADDGAKDRDR